MRSHKDFVGEELAPKVAIVVGEGRGPKGPYAVSVHIIEALLSQGWKVSFLTEKENLEDGLIGLASSNPELEVVEDNVLREAVTADHSGGKRNPLNYLRESAKIARWVKRAKPNARLIIFSLTSPGRFLWRRYGKAKILYLFHSTPTGKKHRLAGPFFRLLISPTARVIGVSDFTRKQIALCWGLGTEDRRLGTLLNSTGEPISISRSWPSQKKTILMVGRLAPEKSPFLWVQVAHRVLSSFGEGVDFVWVGDGPLEAPTKKLAEDLGIGHAVHFPGYVDEPEKYYLSSYLYLHLSVLESLGLAAIDALKYGLPSVVTGAGGLPEVIQDGKTGFVVHSHEVDQISEAVTMLLSDPEVHLKMSANCTIDYEKRFSHLVWGANFSRLINETVREVGR